MKSLETTIKIIGHKRKWSIKETDPASRLIEAVMSNGLIPITCRLILAHLRRVSKVGRRPFATKLEDTDKE